MSEAESGPGEAVPGAVPAGVVLIEATNTHLYPGARGRAGALPQEPAPCLVVFADGARAAGRIAPLGEGFRLDLGAHRTARGRAVAARTWRLAQAADGTLRVLARIGGEGRMGDIEGFARYAVYWAPEAGSGLAAEGARWLGWEPESGQAGPPEGGALSAEPRRYGLHATLKPPFRLAAGASAAALDAAIAALAARLAPAQAPGLVPDAALGFVALRPAGPCPVLDAVAAACVTGLDTFRAPPDSAELARRRAAGLDARGAALLAAWGYPHVLDRFRFHVTLTGRVCADEAARLMPRVRARFAPHLGAGFTLAHLCLFGDPGAGGGFRLLRRHALSG